MKEFLMKCACNLIYGGIRKDDYHEIKSDIHQENRNSLMMISFFMVVMFVCLFVCSLFFEIIGPNRLAYGGVAFGFLVIGIVCRYIKGRYLGLVVPLWYVAMTLVCVYAIVLNTVIQTDISATTFCVALVAAPLLFSEQPWRLFLYYVFFVLIFIYADFHHKEYFLAFSDMVNVMCCMLLSCVINFRIIQAKRCELLQRHNIEKDRDTDKLTGCLTKAAFENQITNCLGITQKQGILIVMDVDFFKTINDSYGHIYGDMVLRNLGDLFYRHFPKSAVFGRFGGDEFQVWIPGKYEKMEVAMWLNNLLAGVNSIETPDKKVKIGISVGVALFPKHGDKYQQLFESADEALYLAKDMGKNRYVFCKDKEVKQEQLNS